MKSKKLKDVVEALIRAEFIMRNNRNNCVDNIWLHQTYDTAMEDLREAATGERNLTDAAKTLGMSEERRVFSPTPEERAESDKAFEESVHRALDIGSKTRSKKVSPKPEPPKPKKGKDKKSKKKDKKSKKKKGLVY